MRMTYLSPQPDSANKLKLLTQVREAIRTRYYHLRTEKTRQSGRWKVAFRQTILATRL